MFSIKWIVRLAATAVAVSMLLSPAQAQKKRVAVLFNEDDTFLALRDAARSEDAATGGELAARLVNYSMPSYVDYYQLRSRLKLASGAEIRDFLLRYNGSAIADRLRNDWLIELGKARDWSDFDEQYPQFALNDDVQVKCFALMSKALKAQNVAEEARALLISLQGYGEGCPALIATLVQNGQFNAGDVWAQFRLIAESGSSYSTLIRRLAGLVDMSEARLLPAFDKPERVVARGAGTNRSGHEMFIIALGRTAKINPTLAVNALTEASELTVQERALGWSAIALQSSLKLAPDAALYWNRAVGAPLSADGHQWKIRSALRAGDWKLVKSGVDAMPLALRNDPAWIYWRARALKVEGKLEEANVQFQSITAQTNFYGQLALEELGQKTTIPLRAQPPTPVEMAPMAENQGFRRALKFFNLNLRLEGYREWNWELRKMTDREHLAAAEFARQSNVLDRMVNTSDRTKVEVDFTQRFPSPFNDIMHPATQTLGLDKAWVYGLIRQESRFIMNARSHVGASGLMQLMPATASWVARKIGMGDFTQSQVNNINVNIMLGTNYLNMVLGELDGSQALATAAYNAGPGRPRAWRATLTRPVEGAIFVESIPFTETRGYVKNVLSNATYYAALFEGKPQSLKSRLALVMPKGGVTTDLP
jgi:soluble lytic murein transglycosylase